MKVTGVQNDVPSGEEPDQWSVSHTCPKDKERSLRFSGENNKPSIPKAVSIVTVLLQDVTDLMLFKKKEISNFKNVVVYNAI